MYILIELALTKVIKLTMVKTTLVLVGESHIF